ncbi:hypothetical protein MTR67_041446 [Solanum verrucosum]|uniref:Uncharacterized protein n=1 Tax=Solanum verrucosum TaxID=315347 RepID=A0AAF0UMQ6_SOLVR|nr:hypothetical protein MTR67_041444 [Solanum verrucosum]WMV48061.1 hypothetical protein MTR67_041446 [Solanum verrucosum]
MAQLVWRVVIRPGIDPPSMSSELSLSHRVCLVRFTSPVWFAGYYTVKGLSSAHKVLTRKAEAVVEIVFTRPGNVATFGDPYNVTVSTAY